MGFYKNLLEDTATKDWPKVKGVKCSTPKCWRFTMRQHPESTEIVQCINCGSKATKLTPITTVHSALRIPR